MFGWVGAVVVVSAMAASSSAAELPTMQCDGAGRYFVCAITECERLRRLPVWTLYTDPPYIAHGLAFSSKTPRDWTIIECLIVDDAGHEQRLRTRVKLHEGSTRFIVDTNQ